MFGEPITPNPPPTLWIGHCVNQHSPRTSRCGNQLPVITLFGLSSISPSNFHKTLWGIRRNTFLNVFWMRSGSVDMATTDPNVKYITPLGESSMNSWIFWKIMISNKTQEINVHCFCGLCPLISIPRANTFT